jgi:PPOX class probable F420-dependent enzyme
MILNNKVRQALTAGNLAHLVTLNKDGSPHVSIVWVGLDGDEIVCAHLNLYKKLKNIQRDARVALSMATGGKTNGLDNYLVINGHARITEGGAPELVNRLAQIYITPGTTFVPDGAPEGYILHITAERVYGIGPWNELRIRFAVLT